MIPARYARFVFGFIMSGLMALLMTAVVTVINTGLDAGFPIRWANAFVVSWPVAFCAVLVVTPCAQKLTAWILTARAAETSV